MQMSNINEQKINNVVMIALFLEIPVYKHREELQDGKIKINKYN